MAPHNEHWSAWPIIMFQLGLQTLGLRAYAVWAIPVITGHLMSVHLLWRIARRGGIRIDVATVALIPFGFMAAGHEVLLFAVNVGFAWAMALGLLVILLADIGTRRCILGASLVALLALPTSTHVVLLIASAALLLLFRRQILSAMIVAGPAGIVWTLWYVTFGRETTAADLSGGLGATALFGLRMATNAARGLTTLGLAPTAAIVGLLLIAALVAFATRRGASGIRPSMAVVLTTSALAFIGIVASGRGSALGLADSSRYAWVVGLLVLPLLLHGVQHLAQVASPRGGVGALIVLIGAVSLSSFGDLRDITNQRAGLEQRLRARYLTQAQLASQGVVVLNPDADQYWAPNLQVRELQDLIAAGRLTAETTTDAALQLEALGELQVVYNAPRPFDEATQARPRLAGARVAEVDCRSGSLASPVTASLEGPGGLEIVTSPPNQLITLHLRDGSIATVTPRYISTQERRPLWIGHSPTTVELSPVSPDAGLLVCTTG